MVQKLRRGLVVTKGVPTMQGEEEFVVGMVPKGCNVVGMVQSDGLAGMKDVPMLLFKEEFVSGMEQSMGELGVYTPLMNATVLLREEMPTNVTWIGERNKVWGMHSDNLVDNYLMKNAASRSNAGSAG